MHISIDLDDMPGASYFRRIVEQERTADALKSELRAIAELTDDDFKLIHKAIGQSGWLNALQYVKAMLLEGKVTMDDLRQEMRHQLWLREMRASR